MPTQIDTLPAASQPCMLLHGLISTPGEFTTVRQALERQGAQVFTPSLEGYSYTPGMSASKWQEWLEAARRELYAYTDAHGPVVLGGLCVGAAIAMALAAEEPKRVAGLVLLSPTLFYDGWGLSRWLNLRHIGYHLPFLAKWIRIDEREPYGVKNPQIRKWIAREMRQQSLSSAGAAKLPLWAIREAERLMKHVCKALPTIRAQSLILHAREDEVASLKTPHYIMQTMGTRDKKLVVLENSYHMITLDNDRHTVVREMAEFLRRPIAVPQHVEVTAGQRAAATHNTIELGNTVCQPL
ncbi:MAG: alpha/beta fold hydrolase [Burkholderiales bacterium]|nr:alpha/beta fold hydrolase [Burkholderiales bacterium]